METAIIESSHVATPYRVTGDPAVAVAGTVRRGEVAEDPRRVLRTMGRRVRLLAIFMAIGGCLGWVSAIVADESPTAPLAVDHYQASHVVVLDNNVPDTQITLGVRNLNTVAKRVTTGDVPTRVAERAEISPNDASDRIRVIVRPDAESFDIVAIGRTPAAAESLADLYAAELITHLEGEAEAFADEAIASAEARVTEAEENLTRTRSEIAAAETLGDEDRVSLLEQDEQQFLSARILAIATLLDVRADGVPVVPLESLEEASGRSTVISNDRFDQLVSRSSQGQNIAILFGDESEAGSPSGALSAVSSRLPDGVLPRVFVGALGGLIAGIIVVMFLNRLDNRVRSKRQIEEILDLPVLAEIPAIARNNRQSTELWSRAMPRSRFAEQYRVLASTVMYAGRLRPEQETQIVLVSSPGQAEGKTTTVSNLGAMLAEAGQRVLLVDGDFRRPRLQRHRVNDDTPMALHETDVPGVDIVANMVADPDAAPNEIVAAQRKVIDLARGRYDMILIDTAPLLATNDAVDLLDLVDDVVLVVRAGKTTVQAADRAAEALERRRSHVLGIAITGVDAKTAEDYYYYGTYYEDQSSGPSGPRRLRFPRRRTAPAADNAEVLGGADVDVDLETLDRDLTRFLSDHDIVEAAAASDGEQVLLRNGVVIDMATAELDDLSRLFAELQEALEQTAAERKRARAKARAEAKSKDAD